LISKLRRYAVEEPEDKRLLVRIPRELSDQLSTIAERERRSLNAQIVYMLERAVASAQRRMEREAKDPDDDAKRPALIAA
jgi:hypothetical protein